MAADDTTLTIISRKAAKARGLRFYFTGKPCCHGHISPRYVSCERCLGCAHQIAADLKAATAKRRAVRALSVREQAKKDGETRYLSGKPCPRGHYAERLTVNSACVECSREDRMRHEAENPVIKAKRKAYVRSNPERYRAHVRNRRAKAKEISGSHTHEDVAGILKAQRGRCAYCRKRLTNRWHVDHIIPLCRGGTNDRANIQITCSKCNLRKSRKDPIKFAREIGLLL